LLFWLGAYCAGWGQTPTKEYIYLGGRLVAVESTGAAVQVTPTAEFVPWRGRNEGLYRDGGGGGYVDGGSNSAGRCMAYDCD